MISITSICFQINFLFHKGRKVSALTFIQENILNACNIQFYHIQFPMIYTYQSLFPLFKPPNWLIITYLCLLSQYYDLIFIQSYVFQLSSMSFRKLIGMEQGIEDFQFQLHPILFFFDKLNRNFVLYLEKGMQILGRFEGTITNNKNSFRFKSIEPAIFRLNSHSGTNYAWSLYALDKITNEEVFQETVHFDLIDHIKIYQFEIGEKEKDIKSNYKQKNISKSVIYDAWRRLKREMKSHRSRLKNIFKKHNYHLEFQLQIKNSLDLAIALYREEEEIKSLKKFNSEDSSKAKTSSLNLDSRIQMNSPLSKGKNIEDKGRTEVDGQGQNNPIDEVNEIHEEEYNDNTIVKIMNPIGQEINDGEQDPNISAKNDEESPLKILVMSLPPNRKVSLLSDIIERSYQGSSSYGKNISSSHNKTNSNNYVNINLKDHTIVSDSIGEMEADQDLHEQHRQKLNKFNTLPDKQKNIPPSSKKQQDFRRAKTVQKALISELNDNFQEGTSSIIEDRHAKEIEKEFKVSEDAKKKTSGDPYAKWILIICVLIVLAMFGGDLTKVFTNSKGKRKAVKL